MDQYMYYEDLLQSVESVPAESIISRTIHSGSGMKAIVFGFATGQELSQHAASVPAVLHFLEGEADLTLGKARKNAKAGTWVYMEANLPHSIHARTPVKMLLIMLGE